MFEEFGFARSLGPGEVRERVGGFAEMGEKVAAEVSRERLEAREDRLEAHLSVVREATEDGVEDLVLVEDELGQRLAQLFGLGFQRGEVRAAVELGPLDEGLVVEARGAGERGGAELAHGAMNVDVNLGDARGEVLEDVGALARGLAPEGVARILVVARVAVGGRGGIAPLLLLLGLEVAELGLHELGVVLLRLALAHLEVGVDEAAAPLVRHLLRRLALLAAARRFRRHRGVRAVEAPETPGVAKPRARAGPSRRRPRERLGQDSKSRAADRKGLMRSRARRVRASVRALPIGIASGGGERRVSSLAAERRRKNLSALSAISRPAIEQPPPLNRRAPPAGSPFSRGTGHASPVATHST